LLNFRCDAPFKFLLNFGHCVAVYPERSEGSHSSAATILLSFKGSKVKRIQRMAYRKFKADQLFDGHHLHGNDKVLITDETGKVQEIVSFSAAGDDVQTFSGILSPGLINCHCHLELSHLKNVIPPHTGLIEFLCSVVTKRDLPRDVVDQEIIK